MQSLTLLALAILTAASYSPALAADGKQCGDVLASGTYSVIDVKKNQYLRRVMFERIANSSFEEATDKAKFGFDVPGYFGGKYNRERHESVQQAIKHEKLDTLEESDRSSYYLAKPEAKVIDAWSACINKTHGISARFIIYKPTEAVLELRYHRQSGKVGLPVVARLTSNVVVPVTPVVNADCLKAGYELDEGDGCDVSFVLPDHELPLTLIIETDQGKTRTHLPPRIAYDVRSSNFPAADLEALVQTVEYTGVVNGGVPFLTKLYMPDELRNAGYTFDPMSFGLVKTERLGDGKCVSSNATADGPFRIKLDSRIDINPKDRPAKCRYHWRADLLKIVAVAAGS